MEKINPWKTIWLKPRTTIRYVIENSSKRDIAILIALAGFCYSLNKAAANDVSQSLPAHIIILIAAVAGPLSGLFLVFYSSLLLRYIGKLLGGKANYSDIVSVTAWSGAPLAAYVSFWIIKYILLGKELFTYDVANNLYSPVAVITAAIMILGLVVTIWLYVILVIGLSEAHKYSKWRAFGTIVLSTIATILLVLPIAFLF